MATKIEMLARIEELEAERDQLKAELEDMRRRYETEGCWISVVEAAEILGLHRSRILQLVNTGGLVSHKVGNTWIISRASAEARAANPPSAGRRW